jgi:NAD(P)-dependent dehydrogenase (short-subunit alcohol dehydrogenase family)
MISLITGVGAKGQVGEAVAAGLAARGDAVILVSRDRDEVMARARELVGAGYRATGYACDLADADEVNALAERVAADHGDRLDALVNLAGGWGMSGPLADSDPAVFNRMLRINLTTAYLTTRAFLPLLARAQGAVVFFASESVLEGARTSGSAAYAAAKAGVVALMRSVADEGRELGVRANALAPGSIRTGTNEASMGAKTPYVEREEVASAVAFLTSEASSAISSQIIRLRPSR